MAEIQEIHWRTDPLDVLFDIDSDRIVYIRCILPVSALNGNASNRQVSNGQVSEGTLSSAIPLNALRLVGDGSFKDKTSKTLIGSYASIRLKYKSHVEKKADGHYLLDVVTCDEEIGISVLTHLTVFSGVPVLRSTATLTNNSEKNVIVSQLSSVAIGGLTRKSDSWSQDNTLSIATNSWFREAQWVDRTLPSLGIDDNGILQLGEGHAASMASFSVSTRGSFSTGTYLPMGMLKRNDLKETWLWQVENNGSWRWEIGDFGDSVYLAAGGPTALDHDWKENLAPGASFTSVSVAVCHILGSPDDAFGALTEYRRRIRRKHDDNDRLNIIFNDYMNCLMGDPTEDKIKALLGPVAKSGAEYFVIDAGWYADDSGWWDDVGLWQPSKKRFPSGFKALLDAIRSQGLIPGVWLEPEVIGVRSVVANQLPEDAFFQECGQRVMERGRYQLDYRHPAVISRMNKVIDGLVNGYGVGYFKFDYNIEVIQGTDVDCFRSGVGQLNHNRAYLDWINQLYDRHPDLVVESCSSGAQRMDYAMLAVHSLQSTSDQQDPVLYAAIAAAAPTAVTPEQSATWAYPQAEWDDEKNALTVTNSLLGRVHLSGRLDNLSSHQFALITEGMSIYSNIRSNLKTALPFWPLGLPKWHDNWLSLGMSTAKGEFYLAVWRRGGSESCSLPMPVLRGECDVNVKLIYPSKFEAHIQWNAQAGELSVRVPPVVCARLFHIHRTEGVEG